MTLKAFILETHTSIRVFPIPPVAPMASYWWPLSLVSSRSFHCLWKISFLFIKKYRLYICMCKKHTPLLQNSRRQRYIAFPFNTLSSKEFSTVVITSSLFFATKSSTTWLYYNCSLFSTMWAVPSLLLLRTMLQRTALCNSHFIGVQVHVQNNFPKWDFYVKGQMHL